MKSFSIRLVALCLLAAPAEAAVTSTTQQTSTTTTLHHKHKTTTQTTTVTKTTKKSPTTTSHTPMKHESGTRKPGTHTPVTSKTVTKTRTASPGEAPPHRLRPHDTAAGRTGVEHTVPGRPHHPSHAVGPAPKPPPPPPPSVPIVPSKPPPPPVDPNKGTASGLPLPRFVALRSDQVNLRAGPGARYPIDWIYQRRFLPVEVTREFEAWRLVTMADGTKGWVNQATLTSRRSLFITAEQPQTLRAAASDTAAPVAILKPGVVGQLLNCPANSDWCAAQVKTYRGYLNRSGFWGTLPGEVVAP